MTIKEWLNSSKNFAVGIALYNVHGTDPLLKEMFAQGYSLIREERLYQELLQLRNTDFLQAPDPPAYDPQKAILTIQVAAVAMPEQKVPEQKDPLRAEWLPLYQEMNLLRHSLESLPDDMQRGRAAFRILTLEQQCMAIWARRDFQIRTGRELPTEPAEEINSYVDVAKLQQRIQTVRTYISKYQKPSDKPKRQQQLLAYQKELEELIRQLNKRPSP